MLLKVESFSSGSDQFPELLHFLKPAVQLDGCSAEELVRRPIHCVRVVFCKKRNLILQHFEPPPTISHLMKPIASFWQKVWRGIYNIYRLFIFSTLYSWKASVLPIQQDIYYAFNAFFGSNHNVSLSVHNGMLMFTLYRAFFLQNSSVWTTEWAADTFDS